MNVDELASHIKTAFRGHSAYGSYFVNSVTVAGDKHVAFALPNDVSVIEVNEMLNKKIPMEAFARMHSDEYGRTSWKLNLDDVNKAEPLFEYSVSAQPTQSWEDRIESAANLKARFPRRNG